MGRYSIDTYPVTMRTAIGETGKHPLDPSIHLTMSMVPGDPTIPSLDLGALAETKNASTTKKQRHRRELIDSNETQ